MTDTYGYTPKQNNFVAVNAPTADTDTTKDYNVGSFWIDTKNNVMYICVSAEAGRAVWKKIIFDA